MKNKNKSWSCRKNVNYKVNSVNLNILKCNIFAPNSEQTEICVSINKGPMNTYGPCSLHMEGKPVFMLNRGPHFHRGKNHSCQITDFFHGILYGSIAWL